MYNHSSFNQPGCSYVQDSTTLLSNLFDLKRDKQELSHGYNYQKTSSSHTERPEPFEEPQLYHRRTPDIEVSVPNPVLICSPAWSFLKQFNSTNPEETNPQEKNISDLFDLPCDRTFVAGSRNRDGIKPEVRGQYSQFLNRLTPSESTNDFGFQGHQVEGFENPIPQTVCSSLYKGQYKNKSINQIEGANKMLPSSDIEVKKPRTHNYKSAHYRIRRRKQNAHRSIRPTFY